MIAVPFGPLAFWLLRTMPDAPITIDAVRAASLDLRPLSATLNAQPTALPVPGLVSYGYATYCQYDEPPAPFDFVAIALVTDSDEPSLVAVSAVEGGAYHVRPRVLLQLRISIIVDEGS